MSDDTTDESKKKSGGKGLLVALVLFLASAGGGFYAVYSGMLLGATPSADSTIHAAEAHPDQPAPSFVPLQPLMVTLGRGDALEALRFEGYLDVRPGSEEAVAVLMPRIMDVLNGYLRAVEIGDLADPSALMTLRAQLLRRIQVVVGDGMVNDLLISKFLLS
ncbi:MAG: flagellar basal body-associated FliL family protein [Rhodobacteraceae bacterium]|nr:flagellar basal body-associated FliL family protein [Paracoccaceae bacterium]